MKKKKVVSAKNDPVGDLLVRYMSLLSKLNKNIDTLDIKKVNITTPKENYVYYQGAKIVYEHIIKELIKILKNKK